MNLEAKVKNLMKNTRMTVNVRGQVTAEEVSEKDIIGGVTSKEDHELMEQILAGN